MASDGGKAGEPVVVITGAASGIGAALARHYAKAGARLALLDRDLAGVEALDADTLGTAHAPLPIGCDITSAAACEQAIEQVIKHFGQIDVLINNAGITHVGTFAETDPDVIRRVMDVNFFGALYCTKAALSHLLASQGRIVVMSSVAGFAPLARRTGYAASKHALHGLFDTLRSEVAGQGVSVTMVCPSFVRTSIGANALGVSGGASPADRGEVGQAMEPDEIAALIHRAAERRQRRILIGRVGKLSYWVSRLFPASYERIMLSSQPKP
ncbi:MAG: SDR family oxidoreductase [Myxococcota bacterium]|jgi:NAD(P)-dependent dehydrogenase (short-subunit alcohol dehydrogenase family)|nr:SDR family oxidoreductase [Myxococcota bacterium]